MMDVLILKIGLIGVLGIGAQWLAWRTARPAIAFMLAAGILAGPVLGLLDPAHDLGDLQGPIIKLAVAVILFEGGLSLNFRDLRHAGGAVLRLVFLGVPIGWGLGAAAAHYGAGLSWPISALFGGILVVTGPTVIGPMLRALNIPRRTADTLKWEAIVNDPIGAMLAVAIYAYISASGNQGSIPAVASEVALAAFIAVVIGLTLGFAITWAFPRDHVPEYLKAPVLLVCVIAGFVAADIIHHETGLITVTVMGVVLANRPMLSSGALRRFKEDLSVILTSGVFVILAATLDWHVISAFRLRFVLFLLLLLFLVRPVTVLVSLLFSKLSWKERIFIAWIAPRGIVAVAVTGLFALRLEAHGVADADALVPLSFAVASVTILAHGFTAQRWARYLGLDGGKRTGVMLVGVSDWSIALGRMLNGLDVPVTIVDTSKFALRDARKADLPTLRGDLLDEEVRHHVNWSDYQAVLAVSTNDAYNALVCSELGPEIGFNRIFQIAPDRREGMTLPRGNVLFADALPVDDLLERTDGGWRFSRTKITETFTLADLNDRLTGGGVPLAVLGEGAQLRFWTVAESRRPVAGEGVISFLPPEPAPPPRPKATAQAE